MTHEPLFYEQQLKDLAANYRISVFFDGRAKRNGHAHINLNKYGMCLADFHYLSDAIAWFPTSQNHEPGAAGTLIHQSANF